MKILTMDQGTLEWHRQRLGVPTASRFHEIITAAKGALSTSAKKYAAELVAERLGFTEPRISTGHMQHGIDTEPAARSWAEWELDEDIIEVGMVFNDEGTLACSPDGLIYSGGDPVMGFEVKCPMPKTHILWTEAGVLPPTHVQQVHGSMAVTGLSSWWFMSYVEGLMPFLLRVERDGYTDQVAAALHQFTIDLAELAGRYIPEAA